MYVISGGLGMKEFTLNKLWALRGELDQAIEDGNYDVIKDVADKYRALTDGEKWFSRAFVCYNYAFWNDGQRTSHNFANVDAILKNIKSYESRYIGGEDVSIKLRTQSTTPFLAGEIWVLRAMYDKLVLQSKMVVDELQIQQNMILGKAIYERLLTLLGMEQTEDYHAQIISILKEVKGCYENVYGKKQPKIDYGQLTEEFLER